MKMLISLLWRFLRFNRYMVECEFEVLGLISKIFGVLIDTWWNVN